MKLGFVTPRYGEEILGGAETGARLLAERLVKERGWEVEVFTSCALDHITWDDHFPPGDSRVEGVGVRRFSIRERRVKEFYELDGRLRRDPSGALPHEARRWVELNGPDCPGLSDAVAASDVDALAFYPYLFRTTVECVEASAHPCVLHPAAHDEPALYLPVFASAFARADGFVYHSTSERSLVERVFRVSHRPQTVLGLGVETGTGAGRPGGEVLGLGDRPYLVCVGRVDEMKGSRALADLFAAYKERAPGPLALALVGPVVATIARHPDIVVTGPLGEADKRDALAGSVACVSPSAYESFSLVIMEAWSQGVPVMVNSFCEVTREHCERSGGGIAFDSANGFAAGVDFLLQHGSVAAEMGERGRSYVAAHFRWEDVIARYARFVETVVDRSKGGAREQR